MKFFDLLNTILSIFGFCGITVMTIVKFILKGNLKAKALRYYSEIKVSTVVISGALIVSWMFSAKPWNKFHYGDSKERIVYVDSSKLKFNKITSKTEAVPPVLKPIEARPEHTIKKITKEKYYKIDTPKEVPATSQTGKNNFNMNGGTILGPVHNGDVLAQPHLTDDQLNPLPGLIESYKKQWKITSNEIEISFESGSNGQSIKPELEAFLKTKGYTTKFGGVFSFSETHKNILIHQNDGKIALIICTF